MSAPTPIYLVAAGHGAYSDRSEWTVCAYGDREQAELHCKALNEAAKKIPYRYGPRDDAATAALRLLDPVAPSYVDSEAEYVVVEINLWRHFDEFQGLE
jgi:hypothetical protein